MKSSKKVNKKRKDPLSADLSDILENGHWEKVKFELRPKNKVITLRLSEDLLELVKLEAKKCGLDYQKFIRLSLERVLLKTS